MGQTCIKATPLLQLLTSSTDWRGCHASFRTTDKWQIRAMPALLGALTRLLFTWTSRHSGHVCGHWIWWLVWPRLLFPKSERCRDHSSLTTTDKQSSHASFLAKRPCPLSLRLMVAGLTTFTKSERHRGHTFFVVTGRHRGHNSFTRTGRHLGCACFHLDWQLMRPHLLDRLTVHASFRWTGRQ